MPVNVGGIGPASIHGTANSPESQGGQAKKAGRTEVQPALVPVWHSAGRRGAKPRQNSALARLEALLDLVDDVDAALAAHELVVAMTETQRLERIADLHGSNSHRLALRRNRSKILARREPFDRPSSNKRQRA
jgi:hypothetical protein